MNYELARMTSLAALIVSPTMMLLAMQMPFWLPPPRQPALQRVVYADFGLPCGYRGPAAWDVTAEKNTFACKFPLQDDNLAESSEAPRGPAGRP
jgi:hypothetical protein